MKSSCRALVLAAPDFSRLCALEVYASDVGAGAVLMQDDSHVLDHPVSFFSCKFNVH